MSQFRVRKRGAAVKLDFCFKRNNYSSAIPRFSRLAQLGDLSSYSVIILFPQLTLAQLTQ